MKYVEAAKDGAQQQQQNMYNIFIFPRNDPWGNAIYFFLITHSSMTMPTIQHLYIYVQSRNTKLFSVFFFAIFI